MTDVLDATVNGTRDSAEALNADDIGENSKSHSDDASELIIDENDNSGNANIMEENDNEDSNALFPDTSQSDQAGDDTEPDDLQEDKDNKILENEELLENENEVSMDLSEVDISQVKTEPHDEDTLISQDDNDLEDEDEQNNYSAEESDSVLLNSINENVSSAMETLAAIKATGSVPSRTKMIRNGDASEDKSLLTGLLNRNDSNAKASSQQRNFSISDGNAIAKELEDQVGKLNQLLVLKEKEWSAILRLKKHVEYALEQVKCTQRMAKVPEGLNGPMSTTEIKACMSLIVSDKDTFSLAERQMEESIENAEIENESLQSVFPFRSNSQLKEKEGSKGDSFTATAALQKLCERKRKAMDEVNPGRASRIRINDVHSTAPQVQSKVIGNGRKGAIVDVQSIIQSHRNKTGERSLEKHRGKKVTAYANQINMGPDRQYLKTLEELAAMAEAERQKETSVSIAPPPATTTVQVNRSITPKPKNGKPLRQPGNNSLLSNPSSSGSGTLAKMLSPSTHSSMGSNRNSNDVSTTSQKFSTKLPTSEANLSLANLLATSKVETKVNLAKVKKERNVREEDNSHVSTQQEAVPICQGCNLSRAQFVCAGCANQWYCSRECQVAAWDEHSEICSG